MKKLFTFSLLALCSAAMLTTGCQKNGQSDYVNCGISAYTLPSAESSLEVTVDASGTYSIATGASWLEVTAEASDKFTLTATANPDNSMRSTDVTVTCGLAKATIRIDQLMMDDDYRYRRLTVHGAAVSPSGRYVATNTDEIREGVEGSLLQLIDTHKAEVVATAYIPAYVSGMSTVTDEGLAFGDMGSITAYMFDIRTGDYQIAPTPEDKGTPMVSNVSADGTKWVGSIAIGQTYVPTLWTDGVPAYLPLPETNYRGGTQIDRILARGISADGNIIYGNTLIGMDMGMLYWKDGKVDWVGKDLYKTTTATEEGTGKVYTLVNGMTCSADPYNISETGKYIGGTYVQEFNPETLQTESASFPAFYNTETETTTIFEEFPGAGGFACRDNGLAVIIPSMSITFASTLVNIEEKTVYGSYQDYVLDHFGIILPTGSVDLIAGDNNDVFFGREPGILAPWWWYFAPRE